MKHLEARITGRVQMVMFRDFACRKARGLGLSGIVQNLSDGSVRVIAEGDDAALQQYLAKLHRGSILSRVDAVEALWSEKLEHFSRFAIVY